MATATGPKVQSAAKFLASVAAMIAGFTKDFTAKMSLLVGGQSMTQVQILAQLASIQALWSAVTTAKNQMTTAVAAKDAGSKAAKQFMADLKKAVEGQFGSSGPQLPDFGIALPKPKAPRTAAEKAASAGLAAQTKTVRGTKTKAAKAKITLTGKPGVVIVGPTGVPLAGVTLGAPTPPAVVPTDGSSTPSSTPAAASAPASTPAPASAPAGNTPAA
jgi:hypothetical protein